MLNMNTTATEPKAKTTWADIGKAKRLAKEAAKASKAHKDALKRRCGGQADRMAAIKANDAIVSAIAM